MRLSAETLRLPPQMTAPRGLAGLFGACMVGDRAFERLGTVGYGLAYDAIFRSFAPYQALVREVLEYARRSVGARPGPRVLDLGCGTGNFSLALAERGYAVVGEDPYDPLVERGRRKAAARGLSDLAFRAEGGTDAGYDLVLSVHVLYAHPDPLAELRGAFARLRQGGHAIVINFARRAPVVATAREVRGGAGAGAAFHSLLWLLPNALFDLLRGRRHSHYWAPAEFRTHLEGVGFEVLEMRPTFLNGISLLAWCRKGL